MTVVVVGSLNVDTFVSVEALPQPGETVKGGEPSIAFGGKGANQAVAAAMAGADTVMIGRVGDDAEGSEYIDRLAAFGIDVSGVKVSDESVTGRAFITVDRFGENCIVVSPGANAMVQESDLAPLGALSPDDVVVLQLELSLSIVVAACRAASARGARVVLNLSPYAPLPREILELADPVIVNHHEAKRLIADGLTPRSMLVTNGSKPSIWGDVEVPVRRLETVLDTTGAGDSYCGTLAAALSVGASRAEAMGSASVAAAFAVVRLGAQPDPVR
jgi:ribokinase